MAIRNALFGTAVVLAILVAARFLRGPAPPVGRVEVTGTVYLDSTPLQGYDGVVQMWSANDPNEGVAGWIDARGRYRVDKTRARDGVAPGSYTVIVTVYPAAPSGGPPPVAVPAKYADAEKSGLTVEVTSEPRQTIDLHLKSK